MFVVVKISVGISMDKVTLLEIWNYSDVLWDLRCYLRYCFSWSLITLSWRRLLSYRNQSIDLQSKSMDWFLYDNGLYHERVKEVLISSCVTLCAICYYLYSFKNVKNIHGGMLILIKLQDEACNFTKCNTSPWVFFTFFKLYKWY